MIDLEKIGREMPYKMPDHFIENLTERVIAEVKQPAKKKSPIYLYIAAAASAAAIVLLLLNPFNIGSMGIPDYENISECKSIDEMFQTMSADDLGIYSMMTNYYGESTL